jgi:hypothetical protein
MHSQFFASVKYMVRTVTGTRNLSGAEAVG